MAARGRPVGRDQPLGPVAAVEIEVRFAVTNRDVVDFVCV